MEYWRLLRSALGHQKLILPSAAAAVIDDRSILLLRHAELGTWHLPGGYQDLDESPAQAAERELREEAGLSLRADALVTVLASPEWDVVYTNGDVIQSMEFCFLMAGYDSSMSVVAQSDEICDSRWFGLDELPADIAPCCRRKCRDAVQFQGATFLR